MTAGRLIAVVGPSGVGKDSVMAGLHRSMQRLHLVRRVITRAPELGGEDFDAVSEAEFHDLVRNGAFALHWTAHGLRYGIPTSVKLHLNKGTDCLANVSRRALGEAHRLFPNLVVLSITAKPETLVARLAARGRETPEEIEQRLAVARKPLPKGLQVIPLSNDGPLAQTVATATARLASMRTELMG